jgi:lipopolysaccharide/colanic/teichoic acid biosynthesis glycosyltransferase/energy-coupling factor transporter ATP-binding protein EcfA2
MSGPFAPLESGPEQRTDSFIGFLAREIDGPTQVKERRYLQKCSENLGVVAFHISIQADKSRKMSTDDNPLVQILTKGTWTRVALLSIALILIWEALKGLAPKALTGALSFVRRLFTERRRKATQERSIRLSTSAAAQANWINCLPALSRVSVQTPLRDIYQPLRFRYQSHEAGNSDANLQEILAQSLSFAIIGPPGSGKSTLLSILADAYARDVMDDQFLTKESRLPLLLPMRQLPEELEDLPTVLCNVLSKASCTVDLPFLASQLAQGHCVVLFDGLDESGDQQRRATVVQWLVSAMAAYPANRFIVSCRTNEWQSMCVPRLPAAYILPLDEQQRLQLIERWTQILAPISTRDQASEQNREVDSGSVVERHSRELGSFSSNPLMLTIAVLLALRNIKIPKKTSELYSLFLRTLLGQWDRIKGSDLGASDAGVEILLRCFERLAGLVVGNDAPGMFIDASLKEVAETLSVAEGRLFGAFPQGRTNILELGERSGILTRNSEEKSAFANRALFEVLVARDLISLGQVETALAKADDELWSEIIVHLLELSRDVGVLLRGLRATSSPNATRLRLLGYAIREAQSRGYNVDEEKAIFSACIAHELETSSATAKLCVLAWHIEPAIWKTRLSEAIQGHDHQIPKGAALDFLAAVDTPETVGMLREVIRKPIVGRFAPKEVFGTPREVDEVSISNIKIAVANALSNAQSREAVDLLWFIAEDDEAHEVAVAHLAERGRAIFDVAIGILVDSNNSFERRRAALDVLAAVGDSPSLGFLLRFARECEPRLHFATLEALQRTQLGKFGPEEAVRVIDQVVYTRTLYAAHGKRILDLVVSSVLLVILAPVAVLIAALIKFASRGPVFFRQTRVGKNGNPFSVWKFRTMYLDAEAASGPRWAANNDPRLTVIGAFLRKVQLDELPQLFNIFCGEMSLVGPRAQLPRVAETVRGEIPLYQERIRVAPGFTGLAQVKWRYGSSSESLIMDLYYISHCSLALDLSILFETVPRIVLGEGAR